MLLLFEASALAIGVVGAAFMIICELLILGLRAAIIFFYN
jgi:hypothetical protein